MLARIGSNEQIPSRFALAHQTFIKRIRRHREQLRFFQAGVGIHVIVTAYAWEQYRYLQGSSFQQGMFGDYLCVGIILVGFGGCSMVQML